MSNLTLHRDSRLVFAEALEHLLQTKSFHKITVNDITEACKAHRSTFYRYFTDKMELAEWYFRYLADNEALAVANGRSMYPGFGADVFLAILRMMQSKRVFFQKLAQYEGQNSFDNMFFRWNMERVIESIPGVKSLDSVQPMTRYSLTFYYYGETRLILEWALNGMKETPEKMLEVVVANVPPLLQPYVSVETGNPTQQGCEK